MWKGIVKKSFTTASFDEYVKTIDFSGWNPKFIVLHNTAIPNLSQRPEGITEKHILNLESFYRDKNKWSGGPHLFIDDKQIWAFTPLSVPGVHSPSFNKMAIGIEMLGDYQSESFTDGRGFLVHSNAVSAVASISKHLGIDPNTMKLHKEDKATTHNCPGKNVIKEDFINEVISLINQ